jgi:hypothetical protein
MSGDSVAVRTERRRHQRVAITLPATVSTAERKLAATLRSISRSGASIEFDDLPAVAPGARVVLAGAGAVLRDCGATVVETEGRVVRLAFEPALPAMELLGVAKALTKPDQLPSLRA